MMGNNNNFSKHFALLFIVVLVLCITCFTTANTIQQQPPVTSPQLPPPGSDGGLNPDDFHRIDIDVDAAVAYHSQFPQVAPPGTKHSRFAYVLIHYEGTPKDDLYVLGTRVVIRSIRESGSIQDVVIICADNVRQSTIDTFLRDGAVVKMVPNIPNPYKGEQQRRRTYKSRFEFTFNKLYIWNLVEYERIIYNDADNLIIRNMDELFLCGHYCPTFFNPLYFHTGMMVVKPDREKFKSLLHDLLSLEVFSYDGADQGFLTAAFPGVEKAPLLSPVRELIINEGKPSEEPLMRFPMEYNLNSGFFYAKFSYDPFRLANLPISYSSYHYASQILYKDKLDDALVLSPLDGIYPPVDLSKYSPERQKEIKSQTIAALQAKPSEEDLNDYYLGVSSLDFCLGPILKPWNWFPFIYFHTVRYWAPLRMRVEAEDWKNGFIPPSSEYFVQSLFNGVLPLLLMPIFMHLLARVLPVMDQIRKVSRTVVRITGSTFPAAIMSFIALGWSFSHLGNTVPLETRPELAWISVLLIIVLAQYNGAFFLAILLSPPCPTMFKTRISNSRRRRHASVPHHFEEVEGQERLKQLGIISPCLYGLTSFQIREFFFSWYHNFSFITKDQQINNMLEFAPLDVADNSDINNLNTVDSIGGGDMLNEEQSNNNNNPNSTILDQKFILDECDMSYNLHYDEPYSTTQLFKTLGLSGMDDNNKNKKVGYMNVSSSSNNNTAIDNNNNTNSDDDLDLDLNDTNTPSSSLSGVDLSLPSDLEFSESDMDQQENVTLIHTNNNTQKKSSNATLVDPLTTTNSNNKNISIKSPQQQQQDTMISSVLHYADTTYTAPEKKLQAVHQSLHHAVFSALESALSLRGGIYPTLMIVHMIILACMVMWLGKLGFGYSNFIVKIAHLASFVIVFILYSVSFMKKIINIALGDPYGKGKMNVNF